MKNALAIVTLPLLLGACAPLATPPSLFAEVSSGETTIATQKSRTPASASIRTAGQANTATEEDALPEVNLSSDLLYRLLSAEIAAQRGQWQSAYITTLALAQQTRDPRLAQRAMEIALAAKQPNEALAATRIWRALAPHSDQASQYLLGFIMLSDNIAEAQPLFEQRLREAPVAARPILMSQIQRLLARAKDKTAGFAMLERLLTPYQSMPETHLVLAQGALNKGDTVRARQEALAAQAMRPESELAVRILAQATPDKEEAARVLHTYLEHHPKAHDARIAYAFTLVDRKQFAKARDEYDILLKNNPQDLNILYAAGYLAMQTNDGKAAEKYLSAYLAQLANLPNEERDPSPVLLLLARLAEERQDTDAAINWLSQIDQGEAYLGARFKRAQLIAKRGDLAEARKVLAQTMVDSESDRTQVIVAEAQLLRDANKLPEAFAVLEAGLKRFPDNTDILYDYGMLAEKANKLELMEKTFRKVIALDPKNQHAYNALGYSLAERNLRLPEAMTLITKAHEMAPNDPFIMDSLGWVHYRLGHLKEAEEYLRRAYALRPDAEIAVHLGEVLWARGEKEDAQKFWRDAQSKDPKNDTLKSTLLRLQVRL